MAAPVARRRRDQAASIPSRELGKARASSKQGAQTPGPPQNRRLHTLRSTMLIDNSRWALNPQSGTGLWPQKQPVSCPACFPIWRDVGVADG